ncbi:Ribosomal protein L29e like protein [Aduncisulcus paluster]|uniref:60S ribosomal protein L29 n=1 Tax=Aduncisulcus paluster TaxID=2918883 RepID=A0ABQ5KJB3_9EUKA|nr:Ribosomal protein L29e like protein [Aduncisulcus paluster]
MIIAILSFLYIMPKRANGTYRHESTKNHKNGIKKPRHQRFSSTKGMGQKFLRNQKWARAHSRKRAFAIKRAYDRKDTVKEE